MKSKKIKKYLPWAFLALVAVFLAVLPAIARSRAEEAKVSILSANAETGDLVNTLAGGGTLAAQEATRSRRSTGSPPWPPRSRSRMRWTVSPRI